jgi:hypothetical protein
MCNTACKMQINLLLIRLMFSILFYIAISSRLGNPFTTQRPMDPLRYKQVRALFPWCESICFWFHGAVGGGRSSVCGCEGGRRRVYNFIATVGMLFNLLIIY